MEAGPTLHLDVLDGPLELLLALVTDDPETGAATYRTSKAFRERTGMASLVDLAPLLPGDDELERLEELLEQRS